MSVKICANCGQECEKEYLMVKDNYLLVHYFDSEEDNVFCSTECLADALSADWEYVEEEDTKIPDDDFDET